MEVTLNVPIEKQYEESLSILCQLIWEDILPVNNVYVSRKWSTFLKKDNNNQIVATDILKNIINKTNQRGQFPLYLACRTGNFDTIKILLNSTSDIDLKQKCSKGGNGGANFLHGLFWRSDDYNPKKPCQTIYEIFKYFLDKFKVLTLELLQTEDFKKELPYTLIMEHLKIFGFPIKYSFDKKIFTITHDDSIYNHFNSICLFTKNINQLMYNPLPENEKAYLVILLLNSFKHVGVNEFHKDFEEFLQFQINGLEEFRENVNEITDISWLKEGLDDIFKKCSTYMLIHTLLKNEASMSYLSDDYLNIKSFIENDIEYFEFINQPGMKKGWIKILDSFNIKI